MNTFLENKYFKNFYNGTILYIRDSNIDEDDKQFLIPNLNTRYITILNDKNNLNCTLYNNEIIEKKSYNDYLSLLSELNLFNLNLLIINLADYEEFLKIWKNINLFSDIIMIKSENNMKFYYDKLIKDIYNEYFMDESINNYFVYKINKKIIGEIQIGIGDIFIYYNIYLKYNKFVQFKITDRYLTICKNKNQNYINFILQLTKYLNFPIIYEPVNNDNIILTGKILQDYPIFKNTSKIMNSNFDNKYIVLNLNSRIVSVENFEKYFKKISNFFNQKKFIYPVILLGNNKHITSDVVNFSFYQYLDIKNFVDKSFSNDCSLKNLDNDINIIKNCELSIQIGIGGTLCLNVFYSPNCIVFLDDESKNTIPSYFFTHWLNNFSNIKFYHINEFEDIMSTYILN